MTHLQFFTLGLLGSLTYFWTGLLWTALLVAMARRERPNLMLHNGTVAWLLLLWPVTLAYVMVYVPLGLIWRCMTKVIGRSDR